MDAKSLDPFIQSSISRVPSGELPESGPQLMIVPIQAGATPADLYRRYTGEPYSCTTDEAVMILIRTPLLSTPDRVTLVAASWAASVLTVDLEIRRFEGDLAANDPWIALVSLALGRLDPGSYDVVVQVKVLIFDDLQHPDYAIDPKVSEKRFRFECN